MFFGSRLLRAAREAERPIAGNPEAIIQAICEEHLAAADEGIRSEEIRARVRQDIQGECRDLSQFLDAAQVWPRYITRPTRAGNADDGRRESARSVLDQGIRSSVRARS